MKEVVLLLLIFVVRVCTSTVNGQYNHGLDPLPTGRPLNIAHRGASGELPGHTTAAYLRAIADGADVIECDVTVTKDRQLVCRHDPWLSTTTNVAQLPQFTTRKKTYYVYVQTGEEGVNITDWFICDFTLAEVRSLFMIQGKDFRDQTHNDKYGIVTLEEFILLAQSAGRPVGIYPELKLPTWTNALPIMAGHRFEDLLLDLLDEYGYMYNSTSHACIIQSFDETTIRYLSVKTQLPLVMLINKEDMATSEKLQALSHICYGVGFSKRLIANHSNDENGYKNWIFATSDIVNRSRNVGLKVHVYTMRNEDRYLAWNYGQDAWKEYDFYKELGVDGYFTDFPRTLNQYLYYTFGESDEVCASKASNIGYTSLGWCIVLIHLVLHMISVDS